MKRILLICLIVFVLVIVAAVIVGVILGSVLNRVTVTSSGANFNYDDAKSYKVGDTEISSKVYKITANWLSGKVKVSQYSGDTLSIKEEVEEGTLKEELKLRWKKDGDEVIVQYAEAGKKLDLDNLKKNLVILVPSSWTLDEIDIEVVSADSEVALSNIRELEWQSVNGYLDVNCDYLSSIDGNTVNGDVTIYVGKKGPEELSFESVNSNITISLPSDSSFTLKRNSINGSLDSEFSGRIKGDDIFIVGNGDYVWNIESVNGDVKILEI